MKNIKKKSTLSKGKTGKGLKTGKVYRKKVFAKKSTKGKLSASNSNKIVIKEICPICGNKLKNGKEHTWDEYATFEVYCTKCKAKFYCDTCPGAGKWDCEVTNLE